METNDTLFYFDKKTFETNYEQSIDTDFSLPDYYPEISKILKCLTEIKVLSKQIKNSSVLIGGQAAINLIYSDNEGRVNSFEHICPFTKSIDVICSNDAHISTRIIGDYINTKATAPRKVEIHGSANINVVVTEREAIPLNISNDDGSVYFKGDKMIASVPEKTICKTIIIEDEITAEPNKPVEKIIRSFADVKITECKALSGKMVIKGEADVTIIYLSATATKPIVKTETRVFSQIIDIENCNDNLICHNFAKVLTLELRPKTSLDGDVKTVGFEIKSEITVFPCMEKEVEFMVDAFSSRCKLMLERQEIDIERISEAVNEKFLCSKKLDFSDGSVSEIFDLWCTPKVDYWGVDNNEVIIKGAVNVSIIAIGYENMPVYFEKPIDFEYRYVLPENNFVVKFDPVVDVSAIDFNISNEGSIDFNVELSVYFNLFTSQKMDVIYKIDLDENEKVLFDENIAVVMFFADNETAWDIAKRYSVCPELILKANNISSVDENLCKVVLVPNVLNE